MITRDFILRQVHQLTQALQTVLFRKQSRQYDEALSAIEEALQAMPGIGGAVGEISPEQLLEACRQGGHFHAEKAIALADLFWEEADILEQQEHPHAARHANSRALCLYESASREPGAALPLDIFERIAALRARHGPPKE